MGNFLNSNTTTYNNIVANFYFKKIIKSIIKIGNLNNLDKIVKPSEIKQKGHETGSSDMGDLSNLMPIIHPFVSVATGKGHGLDYLVEDYKLAVVGSSKSMAGTVIDLMYNGGVKGKEVKNNYNPTLTKNEYISLLRSFSKIENYSENS